MKRYVGLLLSLALVPVTLSAQMPWLSKVPGKPIETRPTQKPDNTPAFPEQTRAPYRATTPFKVTTLISNLEVPWSLAFLPSGNIIFTERLPGRLRIFHKDGKLSAPDAGVSAALMPGDKDSAVLVVVLDHT